MPPPSVPPPTYRTAVRNPHDVREEICRLWRENLHPALSPDERFRWLYVEAPHENSAVLALEVIQGEAAHVVGANGMVPRLFWLSGQEVRAAVSCDFAVDRVHRSLQPALMLLKAFLNEVNSRFHFVYGFPNGKAEAVLKRAGFVEVGRARRWVKVLRYAHYADRLERHEPSLASRLVKSNRFVATTCLKAFDALRIGAHRLRQTLLLRKHEVGTVAAPDQRWDELWLAARGEYDVVGDRTATFLQWRCAVMPRTLFVTLERRTDRTLRAYAVLQLDDATGAAHVRDLFGHRSDLAPLLDQLTPVAFDAGASSLSMRFLGAPDVERHLKKTGFVQRDAGRSVVVNAAPLQGDGPLADVRWHLFDVDEDS